jgi:hypothetical protein
MDQSLRPSNFDTVLNSRAASLYNTHVLPGLSELGWEGKMRWKTTAMSIEIPTPYGQPLLISIGYPDKDNTNVPPEYKMKGTAGFKCNVEFRYIKDKCPELKGLIVETAKQLNEYKYHGRGAGEKIGLCDLSDDKYQKWAGEMMHGEQDYLGQDGEEDDLKGFFQVLKRFVKRDN